MGRRIYLGNTEIPHIYLGNKEITKAYLGNIILFNGSTTQITYHLPNGVTASKTVREGDSAIPSDGEFDTSYTDAEGYTWTFDGWSTTANGFTPVKQLSAAGDTMDMYAVYEHSLTVTLWYAVTTTSLAQSVKTSVRYYNVSGSYQQEAILCSLPSLSGYTSCGWSTGQSKTVPDQSPTFTITDAIGTITYYAVYSYDTSLKLISQNTTQNLNYTNYGVCKLLTSTSGLVGWYYATATLPSYTGTVPTDYKFIAWELNSNNITTTNTTTVDTEEGELEPSEDDIAAEVLTPNTKAYGPGAKIEMDANYIATALFYKVVQSHGYNGSTTPTTLGGWAYRHAQSDKVTKASFLLSENALSGKTPIGWSTVPISKSYQKITPDLDNNITIESDTNETYYSCYSSPVVLTLYNGSKSASTQTLYNYYQYQSSLITENPTFTLPSHTALSSWQNYNWSESDDEYGTYTASTVTSNISKTMYACYKRTVTWKFWQDSAKSTLSANTQTGTAYYNSNTYKKYSDTLPCATARDNYYFDYWNVNNNKYLEGQSIKTYTDQDFIASWVSFPTVTTSISVYDYGTKYIAADNFTDVIMKETDNYVLHQYTITKWITLDSYLVGKNIDLDVKCIPQIGISNRYGQTETFKMSIGDTKSTFLVTSDTSNTFTLNNASPKIFLSIVILHECAKQSEGSAYNKFYIKIARNELCDIHQGKVSGGWEGCGTISEATDDPGIDPD